MSPNRAAGSASDVGYVFSSTSLSLRLLLSLRKYKYVDIHRLLRCEKKQPGTMSGLRILNMGRSGPTSLLRAMIHVVFHLGGDSLRRFFGMVLVIDNQDLLGINHYYRIATFAVRRTWKFTLWQNTPLIIWK